MRRVSREDLKLVDRFLVLALQIGRDRKFDADARSWGDREGSV
jgi:hypothetical protein